MENIFEIRRIILATEIRIFFNLLIFICSICRSSWDPLTLVAAVRGAAGVR